MKPIHTIINGASFSEPHTRESAGEMSVSLSSHIQHFVVVMDVVVACACVYGVVCSGWQINGTSRFAPRKVGVGGGGGWSSLSPHLLLPMYIQALFSSQKLANV